MLRTARTLIVAGLTATLAGLTVTVLSGIPAGAQPAPTPKPTGTGTADLRTRAPNTLEQQAEVLAESAPDRGSTDESPNGSGARVIRVIYRTDTPCAPDIGLEPLGSETNHHIAERIEVDLDADPPTRTLSWRGCLPDPPRGEGTGGGTGGEDVPPAALTDAITDHLRLQGIPASPAGTRDVPGITGLETWYWYPGPTTRTITATAAGFTTTATVTAVRFRWWPCHTYTPPDRLPPGTRPTGCTPGTMLSAADPGSRPRDDSDGHQAAARFTYQTSGTYTLRLAVDWAGTWTLTGPDRTTLTTGTLGPLTTAATRPYLVHQIRTIPLPSTDHPITDTTPNPAT